jgi:hypothetical protein
LELTTNLLILIAKMGYFGYKFISLTPAQVADRRVQLDLHALAAQASLGLLLLVIQLVRLSNWALRRYVTGDVQSRPGSPQKKYVGETIERGWAGKATKKGRAVMWWLGEDMEFPLLAGTYGFKWQWVGGVVWGSWLAILCTQGTAPGEFDILFWNYPLELYKSHNTPNLASSF